MSDNMYVMPQQFGLELVAAHDDVAGDGFDIVALWRHKITGNWYVGHDCGDSTPTPFDTLTPSDLTPVAKYIDVETFAHEAWSYLSDDKRNDAVDALVDKIFMEAGPL